MAMKPNDPSLIKAKAMAINLLKGGASGGTVVREVLKATDIKLHDSWVYPTKRAIENGEDPLEKFKLLDDSKFPPKQQTISIIEQPANPRSDIDKALSELVREMRRHGVESIHVDMDGNATIRTAIKHRVGL